MYSTLVAALLLPLLLFLFFSSSSSSSFRGHPDLPVDALVPEDVFDTSGGNSVAAASSLQGLVGAIPARTVQLHRSQRGRGRWEKLKELPGKGRTTCKN